MSGTPDRRERPRSADRAIPPSFTFGLLIGISVVLQMTVMAGLFIGKAFATWTAVGLSALVALIFALSVRKRARRLRRERRRAFDDATAPPE